MNYLFFSILLIGISYLGDLTNKETINEDIKHDIVLIQGQPRLVAMTDGGEIISDYALYGDYFDSDISHEKFVEEELILTGDLMKTRFISFEGLMPDLDEGAAEHIRYISVLAENSLNSEIVVTTNDSETGHSVSEAVRILLTDFGIAEERILEQFKGYVGSTDDHFVKVSLQPRIVK